MYNWNIAPDSIELLWYERFRFPAKIAFALFPLLFSSSSTEGSLRQKCEEGQSFNSEASVKSEDNTIWEDYCWAPKIHQLLWTIAPRHHGRRAILGDGRWRIPRSAKGGKEGHPLPLLGNRGKELSLLVSQEASSNSWLLYRNAGKYVD